MGSQTLAGAPPGTEARQGRASWTRTIDLSQPRALERFRDPVVLSPHFDDACFSLGYMLSRLGGGDLINIFTHSEYLARGNSDQREVFEIRDREDRTFALRCGLRRYDLGCEEPSLRGRRPSVLNLIDDDIEQIASPVLAKLAVLAMRKTTTRRRVLFAPLGIGRHVNHRATAHVIASHLDGLQALYDVHFYEDLPYAAGVLNRAAALWRVSRAQGWSLAQRHALPSPWEEKSSLLAVYPTQHRRTPTPARFSPQAIWPRGPHEAFWSVRSSLSQQDR